MRTSFYSAVAGDAPVPPGAAASRPASQASRPPQLCAARAMSFRAAPSLI
jgi:hypothetical protein